VQALTRVRQARPDARLLLVGGGPQEQALRGAVREAGLEDKVVFAGRVPHGEVQRFYSVVDVFAYPRRSMRLTELVTPLKPLEAMAQGQLLVASDVGGHRELIRDGETGVLFKAGSADALADAILHLLDERARWPQLRAQGRRFVEEERNWARSVAGYAPVFARLTAGAASAAPMEAHV
jgi:glycosyltransferase involved in cell wall biosynthesis